MDRGRASEEFAAFERTVSTAIVGHEPSRLADQQQARCRIPWLKLVFPETVHSTGGHPGEIKRRRTETTDTGDVRCKRKVDLGPFLRIALAEERDSRADDAVGEVAPRGNAKPLVLEPGAPALLGPEALVGQRLVDKPLRDLGPAARLLLLNSDRDREVRYAVEEVGRAIQRIDDPPRLVGVARDLAAFLEQHAPVGPGVPKLVDDGLLGALVGHRHEVGRTLAADLQMLDLAEVAAKARRRLACGALHNGDQS